jgi:Na+-transporting NADH:ubiquinone oxidoreductase subunit E
MSNYVVIFFAAMITNNIALTYFLGMCPFVAISKNIRVAAGMGFAVTVVMTITAAVNHAVYYYILTPLNLDYLYFLVFIVSIAGMVQMLEILIDRYLPGMYMSFGIYLPLITVNCAILGVSLFMILREYGYVQTVAYALGSGSGWALAIVAMAGLRKYLVLSDPPEPLRDVGITAVLAGLMSLAFLGFAGIVNL